MNLQRLFERVCAEMANRYRKTSAGAKGEDSFGFAPPNPKSWQKLWKKNCTKSVGYTFRLKNYVKLQKLAAVSLFDPDPQISLQSFAQASRCCSDSIGVAPCTSSFKKNFLFLSRSVLRSGLGWKFHINFPRVASHS